MSLTYGFYNSLEEDRRYNAIQISRIFDGLISDGVYQNFGQGMILSVETETGGEPGLLIGSGRAWFNHTWSYNDAPYRIDKEDIGIPLSGDRYVAIVLEIRLKDRINEFKIIHGDQEINPDKVVKPTLLKSDVDQIYQYPLGYLYQRRDDSSILKQSDITNTIGTEECPFVANVINGGVTVDDLLLQWTSEYSEWTEDEKAVFQDKLDELEAQVVGFENGIQEEIQNWYQTLTTQINENAAVNLQNQIGSLDNLKTSNKTNLVGALNESLFVGSKYQDGFKPIACCGLELMDETTARLHIPKKVNLGFLVDDPEYLQPGDVLYCQIYKNEKFKDLRCKPKNFIILNEDEVKVDGTSKYFSSNYIQYQYSKLYGVPDLEADPPFIFGYGGSEDPFKNVLNYSGGFTFLVYQGVINGVSVFIDCLNNTYKIEDDYEVWGSSIQTIDKKALASIEAVQKAATNRVSQHCYSRVEFTDKEKTYFKMPFGWTNIFIETRYGPTSGNYGLPIVIGEIWTYQNPYNKDQIYSGTCWNSITLSSYVTFTMNDLRPGETFIAPQGSIISLLANTIGTLTIYQNTWI